MTLVSDVLLKRKEVMEMLRMKSVNTFYKIEEKLGGKKIGGRVLYWRKNILEYISSNQLA